MSESDLEAWVVTFFGPLYWGFVISTALVGATLIQGYLYYRRCRDPISIQVTIAFMLILDLSSTVVTAAAIFNDFIVNFGNFSALFKVPFEWPVETVLTAAVTCIAQLFFATRIRIVMKESVIFERFECVVPGIIACAALLALGASIGRVVIIVADPSQALGGKAMVVATSLEEGLAVVADLFTTSTLCFILACTHDGVNKTTSPIRRLFFCVLNRGILVTVLQIGSLTAFLITPGYMYWMPFHLAKSKVYTNTLLAMLNARTLTVSGPSRAEYMDQTLPLQDVDPEVSSRETPSHEQSEIPDQNQMQECGDTRVDWDALPLVLPLDKHR